MAEVRIDRGDGRVTVAYAVASPQGVWIFLDGDTFLVPPAEAARRRTGDDELGLAAPMPASVVSIDVAPGEDVKAGDVLILLEAMKMELPVRAPRDGRVGRVLCREGELVQPGVPLIELA